MHTNRLRSFDGALMLFVLAVVLAVGLGASGLL
ncbi:hypothetical protein DSM104329_01834 [Capillimicrobium parvum]|uniref:Uncharacterized protein n=1 Tax=Capillimicrobium parvum TaxID=2884022 RepID=A0A9E7BZL2_9ACTN|nr:hypothetical protein DSM104329_01834 [Capillimicrobium parvum]